MQHERRVNSLSAPVSRVRGEAAHYGSYSPPDKHAQFHSYTT